MDCIDQDLLDMLIKSAILDLIKDGKLQDLLCCDSAPAPIGPDNDTKNRSMAWEVEPQRVSVTDTAGGVVSTIVNFRKADRLDANNVTTQATRFYGTASDVVLGEPNHWVHMTLTDGTVVRLPAYIQVNVTPQPPATTVSLCFYINDGGDLSSSVTVSAIFKAGGTAADLKDFQASFPCREGIDAAADASNVIGLARTNDPNTDFILTNLGWIRLEANGDATLAHYHFRKEADGTYTPVLLGGGYKLTQDGWVEQYMPTSDNITVHFTDGSKKTAQFFPSKNVLDPGGPSFGPSYTPGFNHHGRIAFFKQLREVVDAQAVGVHVGVGYVETPYGILIGRDWLDVGESETHVFHPDDADKVLSGNALDARVVLKWRKWNFSNTLIGGEYEGWKESEIDSDPVLWIN